jgi:hypothetical protein
VVLLPDPDRYEPFVARPAVFGVFIVLLVNIIVDGAHPLLRIAASSVVAVITAVLTVRARRKLR